MAATLEISHGIRSKIKSSGPIDDKLARRIEQRQGKPQDSLHEARDDNSLTAAEKAPMGPALAAGRSTIRCQTQTLGVQLESMGTVNP